ncbi:MAG: putative metallopeptidase [Symbiobacteriia bacterium]
MSATFELAPEVEEIAREVIRQYHGHLLGAHIAYAKRSGTWTSKRELVLGRAVKVSDRDKFFHGYDFLLIVNADEWRRLTPDQRTALVDHELCHCQRATNADGDYAETKDGKPIWTIGGHPVEEFPEIADRHGAWSPALKQIGKILKRVAIEGQATLEDLTAQQIADGQKVEVTRRAEDDEESGPLYRRYFCLECKKRVESSEVHAVSCDGATHYVHATVAGGCGGPVFVAVPGEPDPDLEAVTDDHHAGMRQVS